MRRSDSIGSFAVNGEGASLKIEVLGYENQQPQTVSDANWLQALIQLDAEGCRMRINAFLTTQDVKSFLDGLESALTTLEGTASLTTDEESISLRVKIGKTGAAKVSGELKEMGIAKVKSGFEFASDQSILGRTLSELRDIQHKFPIVESL